MTTYYPTIGLEIHAELATQSKMFCSCKNDPFHASGPNVHICPVCMAHPGAIPVPNIIAIRSVIMMGLAVNGTIANFTEFDRKNYFYPDIPKGYQISQYKYPIVSGGHLAGVDITRVHLEEDTATNEHADTGSLIDFNRAGVPLMELVTEPVIHSAQDAMNFAKELQLLLRTLGISEANMEMGQMRVEANISLSPDPDKFGTKVEIKNLNSFSVVGKAIDYELQRMQELYEQGRESEIVQETRGWDDARGVTRSQRIKEDSADYRYFPDPDIPKFMLHRLFDLDELKKELPELPSEKRIRYREQFGIKADDVDIFVQTPFLATFFENVMLELGGDMSKAQTVSNYILSDMNGLAAEFGMDKVYAQIEHSDLAELANMIAGGELSSRAAKDILRMIVTEGGSPRVLATSHGLIQKNDDESILVFIREAIINNPKIVEEYKSGKEPVIMFLVGQVMKNSKGAANPTKVTELMKIELLK
jgi:aspartyl-tRNA(Asn)/glutamyl-tRNA(Gln) amidotransferase subunit B